MSALLLLLTLTGARAEDFVVDGIKYSTDSSPEGEVAIVGYENIAGDVVIPSTVTYEGVEYEVTCIGGFNYSPVSSVTIPSTVRSINKYAFIGSSLNSIYFESPSSLTEIDLMAFNSCTGLTSIKIPKTVTSIGLYAFQNCTGLTSVEFETPSSLTEIEEYAFINCDSLKSITLPASIMHIDYSTAFFNCNNLQAIHIDEQSPAYSSINGVVYDKDGTTLYIVPFGLKELTIPASVTDIRTDFLNGDLLHINVDEQNSSYSSFEGMLFDKEQTTLLLVPRGSTPTGTKDINLPSTVTTIGKRALFDNNNKIAIKIPSSVTLIEDSAFVFCPLASIEFESPSSLKEIGNNAFNYTYLLTSFTIPASVTSVGDSAFWYCNRLESIEFESPSSLTDIGNNAFGDCVNLATLRIPASVTNIGEHAFGQCENLGTMEFESPSSLTNIASYAFQNCGFSSIVLPASVKNIGANAFEGTGASVAFESPSSLTSIGSQMFEGCSKVEIPSSITAIEDSAFYRSALESVTIPSSVTRIGKSAFESYSGDIKFETPALLTEIGDRAFYSSKLDTITIPASVTSIGNSAFENSRNLVAVKFEPFSSLTKIGNAAFKDDGHLSSCVLPPSLKTIGDSCFYYNGIDTLVIPHSVEYLGERWYYPSSSSTTNSLILLSEKVCSAFDERNEMLSLGRRVRFYSTTDILQEIAYVPGGAILKYELYTVSDARNTGGTLTLSLTDIADDVLQIRALEIGGQRVEANESSAYTFEGVGEGTEFELVVYADILDTEYPIYQTITVEKGEVSVGDVKPAGDGQPEVRGSLAEGRAWVRIPGDGGTAEWTLTATDGTAVAQGRAQADGNWQPLEGAQAAKGLYLLTVRCGQTAKTVKFMAQ